MRHTSFGVAAFLACLMLAPMTATAFEFDSTGGASPGVSTNYADPYADLYQKKTDEEQSEAPNGTKMLQGLQLHMSGGGRSQSVGGDAMGWTNPQPGRLTR